MSKIVDSTGQRFGRLLVVKRAGSNRDGHVMWYCRCDCGKAVTVTGVAIRGGHTVSCGCVRLEKTVARSRTHGKAFTRVYGIWNGIVQRCTNARRRGYARYGGRGIVVCERWRIFENFYGDMGDPPPGASIDRIDANGHYEPGNCRWATRADQNRNQCRNIVIRFDGKTQVLADWAVTLGMNRKTLYCRYARGDRPPGLFRPTGSRP